MNLSFLQRVQLVVVHRYLAGNAEPSAPTGKSKLAGISLSPAACTSFVPVKIEQAAAAAPMQTGTEAAVRRAGVVEIALTNGRSLKVDENIDPAVVARLAAALDGGKR